MPGERITEGLGDSYAAAADLSTHQNKFVKLGASGIDVCGAGEAMFGVLNNDPNTGQAGAVTHYGIVNLVVNAASPNIAPGDPLESGANGVGVKSTADKKNVGAIAIDAATADGVIITAIAVCRMQSGV